MAPAARRRAGRQGAVGVFTLPRRYPEPLTHVNRVEPPSLRSTGGIAAAIRDGADRASVELIRDLAPVDRNQGLPGGLPYDAVAVRCGNSKGLEMSIREICNRSVVCATSDTSAVDAARLMRQHHIGNVVVVDRQDGDRKPLGVVTDRDIVVEVVAAGLDPALLKLGDMLVGRLVTAEESTSYAETIRLLALHGVRRLPVVNAAGVLVGIVSVDDLLPQLASPLAALADLAGRSRRYEMQPRK
jgi:CBS domain-containing protein